MSTREYVITGPDGTELIMTAPADATPEQLRSAAQRAFSQRQQPKAANPAEGIGSLQAGLIAAGRGTDKIVQGVRQLYNKATGDTATLAKMAGDEAEKDRLFKPLQEARPVATAVGGAVPALAIPAGGATTAAFVGRSALAGAMPGLLSYGDARERLTAGAVGGAGGAVGGALGLGAARLLKPAGAAGGLSDEAISAAERVGMKLTAGQRTQNPAMQNFENYLARSPGSSGAMAKITDGNQRAINRAAAKAIGQNGDELTEGTFKAAKDAIGAEFGRLQEVTAPKLGNEFMEALTKIDADNVARGPFKSAKIDGLIDKGLDLAAKGDLSGKAYKEIRTQLSNEAQAAFQGGDATLGQALKSVRKALDDAAKASLSKADQEAWDITRAQWMAYKQLTRSNVAEAGNVSAARLASGLRRGSDNFRTGQMNGPLADIGRVGEALKGVQNPNSGQLMHQMLFSSPWSGIPLSIGNKAASLAYMNPLTQRYLAGGLLDVGETGRVAIGNAGLLAGIPMTQSFLGAQ